MPTGSFAAAALPRTAHQRGSAGFDAGMALFVAALCAVGLFTVWALADHVYAFQLRDATALHDFTLLNVGWLGSGSIRLLHLLEPLQFTLWGLGLVLIALARDRPRVALAVVAVLSLAPLTAELLKPALAHPHLSVDGTYVGAASWPSGHATAATALALSVVLVVPARLRPLAVATAIVFVLAVGFALLVRAWHMPSDVLGGYLLGSLWAAIAVGCLRASEARWPRRAPNRD
jgi:membrane-associated phospholipid phosphatase